MINIENLSKSYGTRVLFDDVSFQLNAREKIGLVGRNGHGKTTFLRMITGETPVDAGTVGISKSYRIGYVRQEVVFHEDTVLAEGALGLNAAEHDHLWKVEKTLAGLGFSPSDMQRPPPEFSAGYQVRLNLAKVLLSEPDLLLLDEPTNYLDITSIRWVARLLRSWPRELILITHDRSFMDAVVTHILGIHRCKLRKIAGTTEKYYQQIAQEEEIHEKTRQRDERRRKEVEQFISRFRAKARLAGLVQSRIKTLAKMEKREKLSKLQTLDFSFTNRPFEGKQVLRVRGLSFRYSNGPLLIDRLDLTVMPGDRIGVVGPNGRGKTTLLKLLAGVLTPETGEIIFHPEAAGGYYEQGHVEELVDGRTVEEEVLYARKAVDRQTARNICGAMLFSGADALKKIGVLSGGEKSRVMLAKLLVTPCNLLLLDEPTNHLDMDSCDALLAALDSFEGAVVMVTHNELFLHALAQRLLVFQDGCISVFEGTYQQFLDQNGWHEDAPATSEPRPDNGTGKIRRKELRRRRSEIVAARSRVLRPLEREIARLEEAIDAREKALDSMNSTMIKASAQGDAEVIAAVSRDLHQCRRDIDALFDELEQRSDQLTQQQAEFDQQFEQLEKDLEHAGD